MKNRGIYKQLSKFKYESILEYNSFVESNIEKSVSEIQTQYDDFIKKNPDIETSDDEDYIDSAASLVDDLAYERKKLSQDILYRHRQSILFHFYSLFEKELFQIAGIVGQENIFKITDIKGNSPFEQFKLYLKKIEPELLEKIRTDLLFFDRIRLVRNLITHHDSIIKQSNSHIHKIKEFSDGKYKIELIGKNVNDIEVYRIVLDNQNFIKEIFETFEIFINKIYK